MFSESTVLTRATVHYSTLFPRSVNKYDKSYKLVPVKNGLKPDNINISGRYDDANKHSINRCRLLPGKNKKAFSTVVGSWVQELY